MTLLRQDTDYAIHILLLLADAEPGSFIEVRSLAKATGASVAFIHKIAQSLKRRGFISSRRGIGGGIRLTAPAGSISLLSVMEAVQGKFRLARCKDADQPCPRSRTCRLTEKLAPLERKLASLLMKTRLADLAGGQDSAERPGGQRAKRRKVTK